MSGCRRLLVTGLAGSGKSTLAAMLAATSTATIVDLDDGFSHRCERATGRPVPDDSQTDWVTQTWSLNVGRVAAFLDFVGSEPVVLFGVAGNIAEAMPLVDRTVFLDVSAEVLAARLLTRVGNDYGKDPDELANVMRWARTERQRWLDRGADIVANDDEPAAVVAVLLALVA
jgi:shikimate kinase